MPKFRTVLSHSIMAGLVASGLAAASPALAEGQRIGNDLRRCEGDGPAVRVTVTGIRSATGTVRVQSYRGTASDWLVSGRWLHRIEVPARQGTMTFCVPVSGAGPYGIAVRHDVNGNGKTDIRSDGGAMSNNPSINIFNLGKPSYRQTAFNVGASEVKEIRINMRYM